MKTILVFTGVPSDPSQWPSDRSLALQRLAGSNVLGHILNQLKDVQTDQLVLLTDRDEGAISAWLADRLPEAEAKVYSVAPGTTPVQALLHYRELFDKGQWLLALGSHIVEAGFKNLDQTEAAVTLFVQPRGQHLHAVAGMSWAGLCHFRHGTDLQVALDRLDSPTVSRFLSILETLDLHVDQQPVTMSLDTSTVDGFFFANARLLGLGYGSENAIERSYVEDFTVVPPVFLHETAEIENAVVGPFANIEAGAVIRNSVIRSSLVGQESTIENAVLDGSFIGSHAHVQASGHALIVKDQEQISLKAES